MTEELLVKVTRLYYASSNFSAGTGSHNGKPIKFSVKGPVNEGYWTMKGVWEVNRKWGRQFKAESAIPEIARGDGLAVYIAENIPKVGPVKAKKILEAFPDFEQSLKDTPEVIAEFAKVDIGLIYKFRDKFMRGREEIRVVSALADFDISLGFAKKLYDEHGDSVIDMIRDNPYTLIGTIPNYGFKRCHDLAVSLGIKDNDPRTVRAAIMFVVKDLCRSHGHTWVSRKQIQDGIAKILGEGASYVKEHITDVVNAGDIVEFRPGSFSPPGIIQDEANIIYWMLQHRGSVTLFSDVNDEYIRDLEPRFNDLQFSSVKNALTCRVSIISGAAGTGKTFSLASIVKAYKSRGSMVAVTALAGKAAKRAEQSIGNDVKGSTIHRLLEVDPMTGSFIHNKYNQLPHDLIILDEASMVDVHLMWCLLQAIRPDATLVIAGDWNQIPSIGEGNLLRDFVIREICPTVILKHVIRQAGGLKRNATAILNGKVSFDVEQEDGRFFWGYAPAKKEDIPSRVLEFISKVGNTGLGMQPKDVQIIAPKRKGDIGTKNLNITLQDYFTGPPPKGCRFNVGDKVIQTKNNYTKGVFNGTIGTVLACRPGYLEVAYEDGTVEYEGPTEIDQVDLSYALTIHKVQGSEFPIVVAIIHETDSFMLHKNLLYTAATRAQKMLFIIGTKKGVMHAACREDVSKRQTLLSIDEWRGIVHDQLADKEVCHG